MQNDQSQEYPVALREELSEAVWSKPLKILAEDWNTTYSELVKAYEELEVPSPTQ